MANEKRARFNSIGGLIEDNPLTSVATTLNSAGLAAMGLVDTTNHAAIVLDPDGIEGAPEIAYVTAHAVAATSATILRAQEGTAALAHSVDVPWVHAATVLDVYEPWLVDINPQLSDYSVAVGTWGFNTWGSEGATLYPNGGLGFYNTAGAQNDALSYPIALSAGLWTITLHTRKSSNLAIYTVQIDGATVGTYDGYSASATYGKGQITAVGVTAGLHTLKLLAATKNASSTQYFMEIFGISLRRTT